MSMNMASTSESQLKIESPRENRDLTIGQFHKILTDHAKWKERSEETSRNLHVSQLSTLPRENSVSIALLGDSMFERMKTTGKSASLEPWPSTDLLLGSAFNRMKASNPLINRRYDGVFNAGVGGDGVQNIIYRLAGDKSKNLDGLLPALAGHNIKLFVIQCGTNNLHPKKGFQAKDIQHLRLILQAILRICRAESKVLVTGLFYRNDIHNDFVDDANADIHNLVDSMNENINAQRFYFLPPAPKVEKSHLVDHVHLSLDGYRLWMEVLVPKMAELLREVNLLRSAGKAIREHAEHKLLHSLRMGGEDEIL